MLKSVCWSPTALPLFGRSIHLLNCPEIICVIDQPGRKSRPLPQNTFVSDLDDVHSIAMVRKKQTSPNKSVDNGKLLRIPKFGSLGDAADGSRDFAIEVNPRLTTSYVGLRALAEFNLADAMLKVAAGEDVEPFRWKPGRVRFAPDGAGRAGG